MFEKIRDIVCEQLGLEKEKVTEESKFVDDLGCDSLDLVELTVTAEEQFGLSIPDEALAKILTIGDLAKFVEENKKK